jgi:hypothetical protein
METIPVTKHPFTKQTNARCKSPNARYIAHLNTGRSHLITVPVVDAVAR